MWFSSPQSKQQYVMEHNPRIFFSFVSLRRNKRERQCVFFVAICLSEVCAPRASASCSPLKQQKRQKIVSLFVEHCSAEECAEGYCNETLMLSTTWHFNIHDIWDSEL